jgi:cell division septal protein FtsQ
MGAALLVLEFILFKYGVVFGIGLGGVWQSLVFERGLSSDETIVVTLIKGTATV